MSFAGAELGQGNCDAKDNQEDSGARNQQTRSGKLESFALQVILVSRHLGYSFDWHMRGSDLFSVRNPGAPRKGPGSVLNQRAPNSYPKNVGNVPQFRGARTLTSDRDTLATAPAQEQGERLGMGLSFPPIFLR